MTGIDPKDEEGKYRSSKVWFDVLCMEVART